MATVTPALPRGDVFADASAASLGLDGPNASEDPWGVSVPQSGLGLLNGLDARAFAALHFWKPVQRLSEAQFADELAGKLADLAAEPRHGPPPLNYDVYGYGLYGSMHRKHVEYGMERAAAHEQEAPYAGPLPYSHSCPVAAAERAFRAWLEQRRLAVLAGAVAVAADGAEQDVALGRRSWQQPQQQEPGADVAVRGIRGGRGAWADGGRQAWPLPDLLLPTPLRFGGTFTTTAAAAGSAGQGPVSAPPPAASPPPPPRVRSIRLAPLAGVPAAPPTGLEPPPSVNAAVIATAAPAGRGACVSAAGRGSSTSFWQAVMWWILDVRTCTRATPIERDLTRLLLIYLICKTSLKQNARRG
eukprot:XP_001694452.1 predicted protein [Chlamydomonas reinhardtii]